MPRPGSTPVHRSALPTPRRRPPCAGPRLRRRHADFRFERVRYQHLSVRDGRLQGARTPRTSASPSGWCTRAPGASPPAIALTTDEAVKVAEQAVDVALVAAAMTRTPGRAGPRARPRRRRLVLGVRREPVRGADPGEDRAAVRLDRAASSVPTASSTPALRSSRCRRTSTTPTWPAPRPPSSGSGCSRSSRPTAPAASGSTRWPRSPLRSARGWEYLTGQGPDAWDFDAELAEHARPARRRSWPRRACRPAATTW